MNKDTPREVTTVRRKLGVTTAAMTQLPNSAPLHYNNDAVHQINKVIRLSIAKAALVAAVLITRAFCRLALSMRISNEYHVIA